MLDTKSRFSPDAYDTLRYLFLCCIYDARMLMSKRQSLAEQSDKLSGGLFKIDDTREKVNEMAKELEVMQEQVFKSTKDCEDFLVTIVNQRRDADEAQKSITTKSVRITEESKVCKKLEEIARADLAAVEPALDEAMKALDTLNKKDLSEIKSFARPPPKVEMVMEAVMILKNSEPTWAESKRQLGDVNFLTSVIKFYGRNSLAYIRQIHQKDHPQEGTAPLFSSPRSTGWKHYQFYLKVSFA